MYRYIVKESSPISDNQNEFPLLSGKEASGTNFEGSGKLWPREVLFTDQTREPLFVGGVIRSTEIVYITEQIAQELVDCYLAENILLLQLLEGALPFCSLICDVLAKIARASGFQYDVASIKVSSYLEGTQSQEHQVSQPLILGDGTVLSSLDAYDRVVILDDLIDAGNTFSWLVNEYLPAFSPKQLSAYFMLEKRRNRTPSVEKSLKLVGAVCGKSVPDEWVVGYGLDIRLPGQPGQSPLHLFRELLPGGVYAFNSSIEKSLITEYQKHPYKLQQQLQVYASTS